MGNSNGNNSIKAFFQRPLWASVFIKRNKVTSQENQETVNSLSVSQMNRMIFVSVFLTLLAIAYFIMFYAYNLHPDDIFFSKIAMYLLLFSSFSYALIAILAYVKNIHKPRMARFLTSCYSMFILAIMALYFLAAMQGSSKNEFCPSFLYLLIFAVISSPFCLDSIFYMMGGQIIILAISGTAGVSIDMFLQYLMIGIILFIGMSYFSVMNYITQLKTIRLDKANQELSAMSMHDQLTGINNRHSLHIFLSEHWNDFASKGVSVAFVMIDIDSFKNYNDKISHIEGDECLKTVVRNALNSNLFAPDNFFRFGGDEFLLVIPQTTEEQIKAIGVGLVRCIYDAHLKSAPDSPYPYISISAGGYVGPIQADKKMDYYIGQADAQLYLAKNHGSNCFFYNGQEIESNSNEASIKLF